MTLSCSNPLQGTTSTSSEKTYNHQLSVSENLRPPEGVRTTTIFRNSLASNSRADFPFGPTKTMSHLRDISRLLQRKAHELRPMENTYPLDWSRSPMTSASRSSWCSAHSTVTIGTTLAVNYKYTPTNSHLQALRYGRCRPGESRRRASPEFQGTLFGRPRARTLHRLRVVWPEAGIGEGRSPRVLAPRRRYAGVCERSAGPDVAFLRWKSQLSNFDATCLFRVRDWANDCKASSAAVVTALARDTPNIGFLKVGVGVRIRDDKRILAVFTRVMAATSPSEPALPH